MLSEVNAHQMNDTGLGQSQSSSVSKYFMLQPLLCHIFCAKYIYKNTAPLLQNDISFCQWGLSSLYNTEMIKIVKTYSQYQGYSPGVFTTPVVFYDSGSQYLHYGEGLVDQARARQGFGLSHFICGKAKQANCIHLLCTLAQTP